MLSESRQREKMSIGKSQGHRGHKKVKCENSQALVMINLYVKFNVHCSYAEQVGIRNTAFAHRDRLYH